LKGVSLLKNERTFYAVYSNVGGLNKANPINVNGLGVGQVQNVEFMKNSNGKLLVTFLISNDIAIPRNSIAKIVSADLMGSKSIELKLGDAAALAVDGDTLISDTQLSLSEEVNKQVAPIKVKAEALMSSLDSVMNVIHAIFNEKARADLSSSIEKISLALSSLEHASLGIDTIVSSEKGRLENIFSNIESISKNIKNNNDRISQALGNIADITDTLAKARLSETIKHINDAVTQVSTIVETINQGKGSLGLLVNNDSLYNNLNASSKDLDFLIKDMKENPNRYVHFSVFGNKNKSTKKQ
jgi:phospholipid/cholesterol/gamma-HCH transport system substrate-binding protein